MRRSTGFSLSRWARPRLTIDTAHQWCWRGSPWDDSWLWHWFQNLRPSLFSFADPFNIVLPRYVCCFIVPSNYSYIIVISTTSFHRSLIRVNCSPWIASSNGTPTVAPAWGYRVSQAPGGPTSINLSWNDVTMLRRSNREIREIMMDIHGYPMCRDVQRQNVYMYVYIYTIHIHIYISCIYIYIYIYVHTLIRKIEMVSFN